MPYAQNKDMRIFYEVRGDGSMPGGPAVVLLHGFGSSSAHWKVCGYASGLDKSHRVVLIDARGHGKSARPHARNAYALEERLADIEAVLDAAGIAQAHFCGFSMGGWLSLGMAFHAPERVASLTMIGAHPYAERFDAFAGIDGSDGDAFLTAFERFLGEPIGAEARRMLLLNDLRALCAAATDRASMEDGFLRLAMPVQLCVGEHDRRREAVHRALEARHALGAHETRFLLVPGVGHIDTLNAVEVLLPAMKDFLAGTA
jgi:pimeloyl-ACP methyl ester carboxylesterase